MGVGPLSRYLLIIIPYLYNILIFMNMFVGRLVYKMLFALHIFILYVLPVRQR